MPAQGAEMMSNSLTVIGAGVIGLSCAWRAAAAGLRVTVLDPAPASGASWVAGGMLAPVTEAWPGEEELLELGEAAVQGWPTFAAELEAAAGCPAGLRTDGTVVAATGSGDRAELDSLAGFLARLGRDGERVTGVRTDSGDVEADTVLVAAGAHSSAPHPALDGLVRPVKGEILRIAHRQGAFPPPRRTVRALVDGRPVYVVPRDDGGLVIGATQAELGFDTEVTVGGVRDLLRDAERILPGIAEYALVESAAGLRPGSPDNLPLIGALGPDGLLVATGHHRNGMLLAPVTADAVLALLCGDPVPGPVRAADPGRFSFARR